MTDLDATWDGVTEDQSLRATHRVTTDTGDRVILQYETGVTQVELVRCP